MKNVAALHTGQTSAIFLKTFAQIFTSLLVVIFYLYRRCFSPRKNMSRSGLKKKNTNCFVLILDKVHIRSVFFQ